MSDTSLLEDLDDGDRAELLAVTRGRSLRQGELLFRAGEVGSAFAVLLSGRCKIVARAESGRTVLLGLRGPGELVGEVAVLDRGFRSADVIALEPVSAAIGGADALRRVLAERPSIMLALCRSLIARLRESDEGRMQMATLAADARVAARLLRLGDRYGRAGSEGVDVALPLTQDEIADWIGMSRPAVARALSSLRGNGLVLTARRSITLPDPGKLRAYVVDQMRDAG